MATLKSYIEQLNRMQTSHSRFYRNVEPAIRMAEQAQKMYDLANPSYMPAIEKYVRLLSQLNSYGIEFLDNEVSANTSGLVKNLSLEASQELEKYPLNENEVELNNNLKKLTSIKSVFTFERVIAILVLLISAAQLIQNSKPVPVELNLDLKVEQVLEIVMSEIDARLDAKGY